MDTRKMSRRRFLQLLSTTAAGAALAACAPKPVPQPTQATEKQAQVATAEPTAAQLAEPTAQPASGEAVRITIFVGFGTGTAPEQMEGQKKIQEEYNQSHKDLQIEFLFVPYEEHSSKFSTMLAADMAPDLIQPYGLGDVWYDDLLDVTPYVDRDKYDLSDFDPGVMAATKDKVKMQGLPVGLYPSAIYYNEDLFDQAGLAYPPHKFGTEGWTYDKLVEIARKLTLDSKGNSADSPDFDWKDTVQWGYDGSGFGALYDIAPKFGGSNQGTSADVKTAEFNSKPWLEAAQFAADTIWKWHIRPTGEQAKAFEAAGDPFGTGKLAMLESHSWMRYAWAGWTKAVNWSLAATPAGPHGDIAAPLNMDATVIPKRSHHLDQAWEVAKWMASPEVLPRLCDIWGSIPARKSLAKPWIDKQHVDFEHPDFQVLIDSVPYMRPTTGDMMNTTAFGKIYDSLENASSKIATTENPNVKQIMDTANAECQAALDEYWKNKQ